MASEVNKDVKKKGWFWRGVGWFIALLVAFEVVLKTLPKTFPGRLMELLKAAPLSPYASGLKSS